MSPSAGSGHSEAAARIRPVDYMGRPATSDLLVCQVHAETLKHRGGAAHTVLLLRLGLSARRLEVAKEEHQVLLFLRGQFSAVDQVEKLNRVLQGQQAPVVEVWW